jgi:hypothetical protein
MSRKILILIIVTILGIAGYVSYRQFGQRYGKTLDTALEQEQELHQQRIEELEKEVYSLEEELGKQDDRLMPKEKLSEVFGEEATVLTPEAKELSCEDIKRNITAFFNHLDKQAYVQSYEIKESSYEFFKQIMTQLSETTPRVTGEMVELTTLMSNMAYFYRVLGKKRVDLIREVLNNESDITESVLTTFYQWATSCDRCDEMAMECPSLENLYEYAGFFLNTLAGRSYLVRRNSQLRILTSYYCLLILDKANDETVNRYGIDIRPQIELLMSEINNTKGLIYKKRYLGKLTTLEAKYNY